MGKFELYGKNIIGEEIKPNYKGIISKKFIISPFTTLNTREGFWQERKKAWVKIGIKSELGREGERHSGVLHKSSSGTDGKYIKGDCWRGSGNSIFDPVLTELMYTWFCPKYGQIIDPFAGGSVRGIIAHALDKKYWGCDLSGEQIEANYEQAFEILGRDPIKIKISSASLRQLFNGCKSTYIKDICHAKCCESSTMPDGVLIIIHPSEENKIINAGGKVIDGFLQPSKNKKCIFKDNNNLCILHETNNKPFGCIASPFTLNKNNTLIIRNRYRLLKCYNDGNKKPAYIVFKKSLELLFGKALTEKLIKHLDTGGKDVLIKMPFKNYQILCDNDNKKHNKINIDKIPFWVIGDSFDKLEQAPDADFIFSCPPYGNLEVYGDDPRDLSNMTHTDFIIKYKRIIEKACNKLKDNSFACFVVGDFRDKNGNYNNFVSDTINAFRECGLHLYNEAILITAIGSLPIRITRQFEAGRKMGKTHQNILIFLKGDAKKATEKIKIKLF